MAVRMKDIAQDLGVSTVTVSKVLRGSTDIGAATRQRVLHRMQELNYQPNLLARALASGQTYAVGLVVPDLVHPFFAELAKGLGGALRESGFALVLASSEEDPEIERQEIRTLLNRSMDCILVASCAPCTAKSESLPEAEMTGRSTPLVLLDRRFPGRESNFVGCDDVRAGELATEHLLQSGRRRVAHIGGMGSSPSVDRLAGYRKALQKAGARAQAEWVVTRERFEEMGDQAGYQAMQELLRGRERPDAVFCYNDMSAIGAMQAAMDAGVSVPDEIAFVGCGNLRYAPYLKVPLSSVDQQPERMGVIAAEMALALSRGTAKGVQVRVLEPHLVVRASSGVVVGD